MRSRARLAIAVATTCLAAGALLATSVPAADQSFASANAAPSGDWCPVGTYMSTTGRCCLDPDGCSSQIPALPRPYVLDPRATLTTGLSGTEQSETTPGDPNATGSATLRLEPGTSQVCFTITMSGMSLTALAAHVHKAPRGQTNLVPTVDLFEGALMSGTQTGCRPTDPVSLRDMRLNPRAYYVQVHNVDYPEGAIRGQLGD